MYTIHGISDCPACLRAAALLMERDLEYVVVVADFSKRYRTLIRNQLKWPTFPIIVLTEGAKSTVIGGFDELQASL
jgi:glutaredoxin|tara:strand:+ start:4939 stop:5166 length:228 start_codon:yes stop_codon:yes gene_type:complete